MHKLYLTNSTEVINIKNPASAVKSEIRSWLQSHDYVHDNIFVGNSVYMNVLSKMSSDDLDDFKKEFDCHINLEEVSFDGKGQFEKFKYRCEPKVLSTFKSYLNVWLKDNDWSVNFFFISDYISLYCFEKLSDDQIREFEDEFEVSLKKYLMSCNSCEVKYEFYDKKR